MNVTSILPPSPPVSTRVAVGVPTMPGLPTARMAADCALVPDVPALFVADTVKV